MKAEPESPEGAWGRESVKSRCLSAEDGMSRPWQPDALQASVRLSQREGASWTRLRPGAPPLPAHAAQLVQGV